jgi:Bacterial SH3 domain
LASDWAAPAGEPVLDIMRARASRSVVASLVIAWSMTGASAYALGASETVEPAGPDSGPKYAIALVTAAFLVVLLLLIRVGRARRSGGRKGRTTEGQVEKRDITIPLPPASLQALASEAHLPRWRRPSVVAARFGLAGLTAQRPNRLAFAGEPDAAESVERMIVRYDAVPLVDRPDDVHGRVLDELGAGDEIEIVERDTVWVRVRTPAGREGWVPTMTLATLDELSPTSWAEADVVEDEPEEQPDLPPLEALLAEIVAERQRREAMAAAAAPSPAPAKPAKRTTKTPRTSAPRTTATTRRKAAASEG